MPREPIVEGEGYFERLSSPPETGHVARWDLDKTYLRTDFDTLRDLVRTALERADEKTSHPGAAALIRELQAAGTEVHVLSGSPTQMRRRLEQKLAMDGLRVASLTLKPNLRNMLRLRFRSLRGQLGYKLPALLAMRARTAVGLRESLVGDDAEADALIYSLYADVCAGHADSELVVSVMERDRCHPGEIDDALRAIAGIERADAVERVLIHLDRQTPPHDFDVYGRRLVPFYNYFQAALVLGEDGRISPEAVLRVGTDMVLQHRFDGDALVRSYLDLARRGLLHGTGLDPLANALDQWPGAGPRKAAPGLDEVQVIGRRLPEMRAALQVEAPPLRVHPDYVALVARRKR